MSNVLLFMILVPIVTAIAVLASARGGLQAIRQVTLVGVLFNLMLAAVVVYNYQPDVAYGAGANGAVAKPDKLLQMRVDIPWLILSSKAETSGVNFSIGVDGISLWLIALTALLMLPAVLVSWEAVQDNAAVYYALMLMLEAGMVGVFAAQDVILFYVFFEFTLIPLFFMIGLWGGQDRRRAARKFFIYTLAGSLLTFLSLLGIVLSHAWMSQTPGGPIPVMTFSIPRLTAEIPALLANSPANREFWLNYSPWLFLGLFAGFAIKVPLFPFHTWLPLAHVEAPTAGSVLLAGVLLKIGSYGFLRFALPLVPEACWLAFDAIGWLCVIGILYGALLALAQDDIKKLVAYSSVSHMGFCLLGLFSLNQPGMTGGLLQMINHGLSTGALFAIVGMLYERYHTREIESFSGLARKFPVLTFFLMVTTFSSIGLPGLNGFTGEILSLMGMFQAAPRFAIPSALGVILGAWYMLWLVRRTFFGRLREPLTEPHHGSVHAASHATTGHGAAVITDMTPREICALLPLTVCMFWIGLYPQFFISRMAPSLNQVQVAINAGRGRLDAAPPTVVAVPGRLAAPENANAKLAVRDAANGVVIDNEIQIAGD